MTDIIASDKPKVIAWQLYRTLVGLGLACALLIVAVFLVTAPVIDSNRQAALQAAVFQVLSGASDFTAFYLLNGNLEPAGDAANRGELVFAGFDKGGALVGVAIQASGMGYQDTIEVIYGYDPQRQQIIGFQILQSRETPGLGDRIASYPPFLRNFQALDVTLNRDQSSLLQAVTAVKEGRKTVPWQIDGITGATISSNAVASILQASAGRLLPVIFRQQDKLQQGAAP